MERAVVRFRVAVAADEPADEPGVLAERVAVPDLHEGVAERSAGVVVDDGERQLERDARLAFGDVGADVLSVEIVGAFGHLLGEGADGRRGGGARVRRVGCGGFRGSSSFL